MKNHRTIEMFLEFLIPDFEKHQYLILTQSTIYFLQILEKKSSFLTYPVHLKPTVQGFPQALMIWMGTCPPPPPIWGGGTSTGGQSSKQGGQNRSKL